MSQPLTLASLLLISTALVPAAALAQDTDTNAAPPAADAGTVQESAQAEEQVDISIPGSIVVVGRRDSNIEKTVPQVVSVLSATEIKRTGEGNIAGSLQRVTGLSLVGGGYVYVRGLGDRYSLAMLNGSPLPSPEPLKRVVPLDIFPTTVVASSLVQKSYSPNFPGEFGGGVINLTTVAIPKESFLQLGVGGSWNTETTNKLGYTYEGGGTDWSGFDNGSRDVPKALAAAFAANDYNDPALAPQISKSYLQVLQRNQHVPANFSASITGAMTGELGEADIGMVFAASYGNKWRTRDTLQQQAPEDFAVPNSYNKVITDNQMTVNGLLGFGAEWNGQKLRWTSLFIRDTLKRGSLSVGSSPSDRVGIEFMKQQTAWYERQLIDTQLVGEFRFGALSLDLRGAYANSQREAPFEQNFTYYRGLGSTGPFINTLDKALGDATVSFSDLTEDLWSAGVDATYELTPDIKATAGYAYSDTQRSTSRYALRFAGPVPAGAEVLRPDFLLAPQLIGPFGIILQDIKGSDLPLFDAGLTIHGAYGQVNAQLMPGLSLNAGVRFESGRQTVEGFLVPGGPALQNNLIKKEYWLPAATLTFEMAPQMQVRLSGSKTLARPQFRELIPQLYEDTESNRLFRGNQFLSDSTLWNGDLRWEWYYAPDQRVSAAAFYKRISKPIETYSDFQGSTLVTSFANAPKADLYGGELEAQKYFDMADWSGASFFATRRLVLIANYTYTKSKLKVGADDTTIPYTSSTPVAASIYFQDGAPMTGQSDHIANLQIGLEDTDSLSQQTLLLSYASKRVTTRVGGQPEVVEEPGITLDFVARQGINFGKAELELKVEARNITGRKYKEFQNTSSGDIYWNRYDLGRTLAASISAKF